MSTESKPQRINKQFSVIGIRILKDCDSHLSKILNPGNYLFNEWCDYKNGVIKLSPNKKPESNFFGHNISIQAIVGKNGSGKSSVLEMMYRMINNFAFMLVRKQKRQAAKVLYFIEGLHADLYFVIGDTTGTLYCRGEFIGFQFGTHKLFFGEKSIDLLFSDFIEYNNPTNEKIIEVAKEFFYTIVTNYSFQSFVDSDYKTERANRYETKGKSGVDSSAIWINSLFHKNDGYSVPIVLNPYRDEGIIDLKKEYQLTNYRLSAILIEAQRSKRQFIDEYQLHDIEYTFESIIIFEKFEESKKKGANVDDFIRNFISIAQNSKTFSSIILREYDLKVSPSDSNPYIIACIYLVHKTLGIASKYPSFEDFESVGKTENYKKEATTTEEQSLTELVKEIKDKKSHITVKIRQTLHFLNCNQNLLPTYNREFDFTYSEYIQALGFKDSIRGLDEIIEHLPPPFFTYDIKLDKVKNGKIVSKKPVLFQRMSSGERQFIYTVSTFVYHIKNLLSIQQTNRIRYRNINLILDEVELCFHPEYQRLFVDKLIQTIQRLHLNTHCAFNIIIATHSPFVLSDIPMSNILYLDEGKIPDKSQFINPFGANINDILHQSFFLDKGFMGEYARKRITSLLDFLSEKRKSGWDKPTAQECIDLIGEPIIKRQLQVLYDEKYGIMDNKDREIEELKEIIKLLEAKQ